MATLRDGILDNHQMDESILLYGCGDDGGTTMMRFHQLRCTREDIVTAHAPELLPWLLKYLPPFIQLGDDLTTEELAARYQRMHYSFKALR